MLAGGESWRRTNSFDLSWTNQHDNGSPIVKADYELVNTASGQRVTGSVSGNDISAIRGLSVPSIGAWTMRLWLEDAAGWVGDANKSDAVVLRFDDTVPGLARFSPGCQGR